jgi:iron(II)-dependent oxidoreductase
VFARALIAAGLALLTPAAAAQEMVRVPGGSFVMGSDDGPDDERPAHTVRLDKFEIDRMPVTNADFAQFLDRFGAFGANGAHHYDWDDRDARIHRVGGGWRADAGYETHPAVEATWIGAAKYCRWRGKRLPTEAEWERAAHGGERRRYPWGDSAPTRAHARFQAGWNETAPAGAHPAGASPYGALGMAGNVWHWVSSAYRPYPYRADDGREDPTPGPVRSTRGGGHDSPAEELRATERGRKLSRNPAAGHHNIGFRCAR